MSEFQLGENTFRIGKLDAFKQFHLSRKVAPIIPTLIPVFLKLKGATPAPAEAETVVGVDGEPSVNPATPLSSDLAGMAEVLVPMTEAIAMMPDETAEFILSTCLGAVSRKQGSSWYPVWNQQNNTCMFDDLDISDMLKLSVRVITESLGPFLRGMLTGQGTPKA